VYAIPSGAKRFVAVAAMDDVAESGPVTFAVYGDTKEAGRKPVPSAESPPVASFTSNFSWFVNIELDGAYREIHLVASAHDIGNAWSDWVDVGFITRAGKVNGK
jgi:hypothetical protein